MEKTAVKSVSQGEFLSGVGVDVDAALLVKDLGFHSLLDAQSLLGLGVDDRLDDVRPRLGHGLDGDQRNILTTFRRLLRRLQLDLQ